MFGESLRPVAVTSALALIFPIGPGMAGFNLLRRRNAEVLDVAFCETLQEGGSVDGFDRPRVIGHDPVEAVQTVAALRDNCLALGIEIETQILVEGICRDILESEFPHALIVEACRKKFKDE